MPERGLTEPSFAGAVAAARRKGIVVADEAPPVRTSYVVNGVQLNVLDWQGKDRPPLLLLHGALLHAHVWDFFSLQMRQHFHIRAVDLPGHGDSGWAADKDYSRARVANDMATVVQQLDLRSVVIVGHSFGGAVGALVAAHMPDRVQALVMVDSTLLPSGRPSVRSRASSLPLSFASFEEFAHHAARLAHRPTTARVPASLYWNARELPDGRWTWKYDPAVRETVLGPLDFEDVWSALRAYPGPVLYVRASDHSHLIDAAAERLHGLSNVRLRVVSDAGHNVMTDNPRDFTRAVHEFVAEGC
jgi:pimeloyl-ACP methyl ester carboxylesterase